MSGEALFWIFIVVFTLLMLAGFFVIDRPRPSRGIRTRRPLPERGSDPRGRHRPAERIDPAETDSRL